MGAFQRLLKSSTFRMCFFAALLFAATNVAMLATVGYLTERLLDRRVDDDVNAELDRLLILHAKSGIEGLSAEINIRTASMQGRLRPYLVVDKTGRILAGNLDAWPTGRTVDNGHMRFKFPFGGNDPSTPARAFYIDLKDGGRLLVGRVQTDRLAVERVLRKAMAGAALLGLVLGCGVGFLLAKRALGRLDQINRTVQDIFEDRFQGRVPLSGKEDEFDQLAENLNAMLARIQELVLSLETVTHNIAHDLRTPLNRLRNRLELALLNGREQEQALGDGIAEVDTLLGLINALLSIARIEDGLPEDNLTQVDLGQLLAEMQDFYGPLAEENGLRMHLRPSRAPSIRGDRQLLTQAVANLLDNAIKYTPQGGAIIVSCQERDGAPCLVIEDNGPGIPADEREKVLEPFVRLDASRHLPGAGLGLSVVAAIAKAHGGRLSLEDAPTGLRAVIRLPG